MCLTVVAQLLEKYDIPKSQIGRLEVSISITAVARADDFKFYVGISIKQIGFRNEDGRGERRVLYDVE